MGFSFSKSRRKLLSSLPEHTRSIEEDIAACKLSIQNWPKRNRNRMPRLILSVVLALLVTGAALVAEFGYPHGRFYPTGEYTEGWPDGRTMEEVWREDTSGLELPGWVWYFRNNSFLLWIVIIGIVVWSMVEIDSELNRRKQHRGDLGFLLKREAYLEGFRAGFEAGVTASLIERMEQFEPPKQ